MVSTSAKPVSTCVGGTDGVPIALRRIDSTTEMRTNDVIISSANGISDSAAIATISTSGRAVRSFAACALAACATAGISNTGRIHQPLHSRSAESGRAGRRITRASTSANRGLPAEAALSARTFSASSSANTVIGPSPTPTSKHRPPASMT